MQQKTKWMSYLIVGISLLTGLTFLSCDKSEPIVDYINYANFHYYYVNGTEVSIKLETYFKGDGKYQLLKEYVIAKDDTLRIELEFKIGRDMSRYSLAYPFYHDSTVVIYGQTKCEYFLLPETGGVTEISNYKIIDSTGNSVEYRYVFTQEQYQNAENCP